MSKYRPDAKIKGNVAQTSSILLNANQDHKKANSIYFPKDGSYKYNGFPFRNWTKIEKIMAMLLTLSVTAYGGHEVLKNNEHTKKKVSDFDAALTDSFDSIYHQLVGVPGYSAKPPVQIAKADLRELQKAAPTSDTTTPMNASLKGASKKYPYPKDNYPFTPDLKFFGNETFHKELWKTAPDDPAGKMTYEEQGQKAMEDLKKTPDFTIDVDGAAVPVYDFVAKYLDEMYEGPEAGDPNRIYKRGIIYFPYIEPSVLIHLAIHESGIDDEYADRLYDRNKNFREWKYTLEEFATKVQIAWQAKRWNWTPEQHEQIFNKSMEYYDNILHGDGR